MFDPRYRTGALIYQSCGQDLLVTQTGQNLADGDVIATLQSVGGKLLAFGLGGNTVRTARQLLK